MEIFQVAKEDLQRFAVSVFLAADDAAAKSTVRALVEQIGFTPVDLGSLRFARASEGIADLIRTLLAAGVPAPAAISVQTLPQPKTQREWPAPKVRPLTYSKLLPLCKAASPS